MNVLFLSQRVPHPPDRGDRITTYHFLRHFRERGDRIRVGCLCEDDRDLESAAELATMVEAVSAPRMRHQTVQKLASLRGLLTGQALTLPYFANRELRAAVDAWVQEDPPDLIYVYSSSMAQYALNHEGPVRIMQFAELDSDKWRQYAERRSGIGRYIYGREARLLLDYERRVAQSFNESFVVSDVEKELFISKIEDVEPVVMPNGVDVDHFASQGDAERDPHTLIFTGVMDYEPNVDGVLWFRETSWPAIRKAHPDARLLIVGSKPCDEIKRLDGQEGITVTGRVPETPPYFDKAAVAIAPLRLARGVQNKVLEAMSMGLPVVSSPQAGQGLGEVGEDTLIVTENPSATTAAIIDLLEEPERAREIGANAAAYVRTQFHWDTMFARLDDLLKQRKLLS